MERIRVIMTREAVSPERLRDATAVVIDAFMATTTLLTIFENGARRVFPVASLEEAAETGAGLPEAPVYGGEQNALGIEGYDCGPFPDEYPPEFVSGRDVVFLTTNGTRALSGAVPARELLVGCPRNAPAVARYLRDTDPEKVYVICAGSGGQFTLEDFLGASAIVSRLDTTGARLNDAAWLALEFAERFDADPLGVLRESRSGSWFAENDRGDALEFVGDVGASGLVPAVRDGRLLLATDRPEDSPVVPD